jgi:hypothetical protein
VRKQRPARNDMKKGLCMKKLHLSLALSAVAPFAWAQVAETNTVLPKENGSERHHDPGKEVVYVTRSGKVLDADAMRARIKMGIPVHLHFAGTGNHMFVDRVTVDVD